MDNTGHTTQDVNNPQSIVPGAAPKIPVDMNTFERTGSIETGCTVGEHQYRITDLSPSGDLTQIQLECIHCGFKDARTERLNVNNLIDPNLPVDKATGNQPVILPGAETLPPPPKTAISPIDIMRADTFRKLRQQEQETDGFWDNIKKN